jgi:diadenosine tetraphosphate (Ap4A) HIT family hydrolase
MSALPETLVFWKFPIDCRTVFHATELSFAFTNLKPVIPGHVLVSPRRVVDRMTLLSPAEVADLFTTARVVGDAILRAHPQADSLTFTVQDGRSAGQTVPHVHVHVMPRWATDRFNMSERGNDSVYSEINGAEREMVRMDEHNGIREQTREEMAEEGQRYKKIVESLITE